jgi:endonuclease/exonuclease/phosphatase family metal-dependent hydrolase
VSHRSTEQQAVRVASYNLRALQDDTGAAVAVVRDLDPDVLLLQEVPRHPLSAPRVRSFAHRCGLRWAGRTRALAGTSVLVGPRVVADPAQDRSLPVELLGNPRSYTVVRVARPGGPAFAAVSLHLPLLPDRRRQHARQVLSELQVDPLLGGLPWVVGGDLNEDQHGDAWQVLAEELTLVTPLRPTFPSVRPHRTIDAVFASRGVRPAPQQPVALDAAALRAASDHLPVWADLVL